MASESAVHSPEVWNQADRYRNENASLIQKNKHLEAEVKRFRTAGVTPLDIEDGQVINNSKPNFCRRHSKLLKIVFIGFPFVLLMAASLFIIGLYIGDKTKGNVGASWNGLMSSMTQKRPQLGLLAGGEENDALTYNKKYFNIGQRTDFLLQECQGPELKRSFPDLDYALKGYNVLKAFPLAVGHDPGFSLPIFTADYTDSGQTADCRYSVPRGVVVTPDVSCVVSFTSKIIQTRYEFSKSLSASAKVSGGGWGVSFSASAGYKQASSTISTGEYSYILSTTSCRYYYSRILPNRPPPLHPAFVDWVRRLDAAADNAEDLYAEFFENYGTHFVPDVTFGARYTHENKMESKKLEEMSESGVNVAVSASYSGLFSAGGGFSLDTNQRESASNFQKNVESKTITIGAPPPSTGDAQQWASTVKENPVPVEYKLSSIEDLFSANYMGNLRVNFSRIANNIKRMKGKYCQFLKDKGEVDSCQELQPGLELKSTRLLSHYRHFSADKVTCMEECMAEVKCVAITKCLGTKCTDSYQKKYNMCYLYKEQTPEDAEEKGEYMWSREEEGWESTVFLPKISHSLYLHNTALQGIERGRTNEVEERAANHLECWNWCFQDEQCVAFSYCACSDKASNCHMYAERSIIGMKEEMGTGTIFISRLQPPFPPPNLTTALASLSQ